MVSTKTGRGATPGGVSIVGVGVFGYLFLCLNVLFFSSLLAAAPSTFEALAKEDDWVESLTAVWFLLAGLVLFVTALVERSFFRRCVYILGGMAMMFAAGEEISWGQRIFGFATPDLLMRLNEQEEFTVHNIINGLFDIIYLNGALVLCMATGAAFFCRKDRLFGIPLPSILLVLGFLLILSYTSGAYLKELSGADLREYVKSIRRSVGGFFMVHERGGLLLFFLIFALFSRQVKLVIACAATLALVLALTYVNYHVNVSFESTHHIRASLFEVREYLFGLGCLFYCLEILLAQGRLAQSHGRQFSGRVNRSITMSNAKTHDVKPNPFVAGHIGPAPGRIRCALRLVGWNALFLVEPPRVSRRVICLSQAAIADSRSWWS